MAHHESSTVQWHMFTKLWLFGPSTLMPRSYWKRMSFLFQCESFHLLVGHLKHIPHWSWWKKSYKIRTSKYFISLVTGFYTSPVVQEFFHQQYPSTSMDLNALATGFSHWVTKHYTCIAMIGNDAEALLGLAVASLHQNKVERKADWLIGDSMNIYPPWKFNIALENKPSPIGKSSSNHHFSGASC